MPQIKPMVLVSLDGWGIAPPSRGNCISQAQTPVFDELVSHYPVLALQASGEAVGLKFNEMGNSEVGHLSMGTGTIIFQTLPRIYRSIMDGIFPQNSALLKMKEYVTKNKGNIHLLGLLSDGGVHSHINHLFAVLDFCQENNLKNVFIHVFLDGRDTKKDGGKEYIGQLLAKLGEIGFGKIATISGRYYSMDRDRRWDRIELAYIAMTDEKSLDRFEDPIKAIEKSYAEDIFDEEFKPTVITENGKAIAHIQPKDAVLFFNFRADRARQLTSAFVLPGFEKFKRQIYIQDIFFATFTEYDKNLPVDAIVFPPEVVNDPLAKVISENGMKQLHIAETEKYAHVTYFFNGGKEDPFEGEERILIPSPPVSSYDEKPEMSAYEITDKILEALNKDIYHFIIVNFANPDMVAHTGNIEATKKAIEVIDMCIGKIVKRALELSGHIIITADHGNAESLINSMSGDIAKEHTKNPVPCIIIGNEFAGKSSGKETEAIGRDLSIIKPSGMLADIAPTVLKIMGLPVPKSMKGVSLI